MNKTSPFSLAIIGAGITGLSAAYYAVKKGADPERIVVVESTARCGGKIQTHWLRNQPVNMGAEFVNSEHERIRKLCQELGVKLERSEEQRDGWFQRPNGQPMAAEDFHSAYRPIARKVMRDKRRVQQQPEGEFAREMDGLSLTDYMRRLRHEVSRNPDARQRKLSPEITSIAMHAFASEVGQPPGRINALQFLHEASAREDELLASDSAYRICGGTQQLIDALAQYLKNAGVQFRHETVLKALYKTPQGNVQCATSRDLLEAEKVIFTLPPYVLKTIEGLEAFGLDKTQQKQLGDLQYTNVVKFTVSLAEGAERPLGNFFSRHNFQAWSAAPGQMTFLCNADKLRKMSPTRLVTSCLQSYAATCGVPVASLFSPVKDNVVLSAHDPQACYASPAPGQAHLFSQLHGALETARGQGVAFAGCYMPMRSGQGQATGFMENGASSAALRVEQLLQPEMLRWAGGLPSFGLGR